jgi:hypothetical protein
MSYELASYLVATIKANASIVALIGTDANGNSSVFPYHSRMTDQQPPFPKITIARFGTESNDKFNGSSFAGLMDWPRVAVCVWAQENIESCWRIYRLIEPILRAPATSQYFGAYKARRIIIRDDLFDQQLSSFHLHSEWTLPVQTLAGIVQA